MGRVVSGKPTARQMAFSSKVLLALHAAGQFCGRDGCRRIGCTVRCESASASRACPAYEPGLQGGKRSKVP